MYIYVYLFFTPQMVTDVVYKWSWASWRHFPKVRARGEPRRPHSCPKQRNVRLVFWARLHTMSRLYVWIIHFLADPLRGVDLSEKKSIESIYPETPGYRGSISHNKKGGKKIIYFEERIFWSYFSINVHSSQTARQPTIQKWVLDDLTYMKDTQ